MINHDHDKDHDAYEPTSCSICFRYPDVHNAVQETKMVSHRKRMKLMFASTKMGWAQHHPATMTDGGCYFCILVDGAVQKLWIPSTSIHVYRYIYLHIYIYLCTYATRSQTHKHSKWFLLFFSAQTKPQKHPNIFTKSNEGLHPQGEGLAFKANTGAQILGAWRAKVLHRWCTTCILDVDPLVGPVFRNQHDTVCCVPQQKKLKDVQFVEWNGRNMPQDCCTYQLVAEQSLCMCSICWNTLALRPILRCGIHLGPNTLNIKMILLQSRETTKTSLGFWSLCTARFISFTFVVFGSWVSTVPFFFLLNNSTHHELARPVRSGFAVKKVPKDRIFSTIQDGRFTNWNLQIHPLKKGTKGTWSEPNLCDYVPC